MKTQYYKILSPTLCNRGFQYSIGLNEYPKDITQSKCGMYICKKKDIGYWLRLYHNPIVCEALLSPESIMYKEHRKIRTNRIILQRPLPIRDFMNTMDAMDIVSIDGLNLEYVSTQTPEVCLKAVRQNGRAIQFVKEQTTDLWIEALKQNGRALEYIEKSMQSQYLCLIAVKQNGLAIKFVENKDKSVSMMAVHQNGLALKHLKDPTPYIVSIALSQNGYALQYVKDQTEENCSIAIAQNSLAKLYMRELMPYLLPKPISF